MATNHRKHLETLDLRPEASTAEIKTAYRDLAKVWHPDRFSNDSSLQEKAQKRLQSINEAYEALRDYDPTKAVDAAPRGGQPRVIVSRRPTIPVDRAWVFVSGIAIAVVLLLIWSAM